MGRPLLGNRIFRIKFGKVLTYDLRCLISLQRFGTGVPGQDKALRVEHEDGVVTDALHQQMERLVICSWRMIASIYVLEDRFFGFQGHAKAYRGEVG